MNLKRTKLLAEYGPYGMGLTGMVRPLPFSDVDLARLSKTAIRRREEDMVSAHRRRERLRQLALEQWAKLLRDLTG